MSGGLLVGALTVLVAAPAEGVATAPPSTVKAYATGTALHAKALQAGAEGPQIASVLQAHSAGAFDAAGLPTAGKASEVNGTVVPSVIPEPGALADGLIPGGKEAYARGAGIDVGVGTALPNVANAHQLILSGIASAASHPPEGSNDEPLVASQAPATQTGLIQERIAVPASPVIFAGLLEGRALANWNPNYAMPMLGTPIAFGEGNAADVQLLNAAETDEATGEMLGGLLNTNTPGNAAANTKSFTYLVNNGDGTCGVATEIRQIIAPVRVNMPPDDNPLNDTTIEVLGEWVMRGVATGKGPATLSYPVGDEDDPTSILRVTSYDDAGAQEIQNIIGFDDLFDDVGFNPFGGTPLAAVADPAIAEPPRNIAAPGAIPTFNAENSNPPVLTTTQLRAAADILRVPVLNATAGTPDVGEQGVDFRLGHFEMSIDVPAGGINCEIPIDKSGPPTINIGTTATFNVRVPIDADALRPFPCKLTSITVTDVVSVEHADTPTRPPVMNILSGQGPPGSTATVSADKKSITFTNLPTYTPGQPVLNFAIQVQVPNNSGQGRMRNTATATATPGECNVAPDSLLGQLFGQGGLTGGAAGFLGSNGSGLTGRITGASSSNITGSDVVGGIGITAGRVLAVTGRNEGMVLGLALGALVAAVGAVRLRRRVTTD